MRCNNCAHYDVCYQYDILEEDEDEMCALYEQKRPHGEWQGEVIKTDYEQIDKQEIQKSVHLLDLFTKTFCRYVNDYERFDDLKFRCDECPFYGENGICRVKDFKNRYAPDYRDFGSMGDL